MGEVALHLPEPPPLSPVAPTEIAMSDLALAEGASSVSRGEALVPWVPSEDEGRSLNKYFTAV